MLLRLSSEKPTTQFSELVTRYCNLLDSLPDIKKTLTSARSFKLGVFQFFFKRQRCDLFIVPTFQVAPIPVPFGVKPIMHKKKG